MNQFKGLPPGSPPVVPASGNDSAEGPALSTALQEQLGLRLEKARAPLDVIVVEKANKTPTDN